MKHETATSVRQQVSAAEWDARVNLAAAYRLVALYGWDDLVFTHVSARVPGSEHHFLINPYGMMFEEITASSLVKIDLGGRKIMDSPHEINPAGFRKSPAVQARGTIISARYGSRFRSRAYIGPMRRRPILSAPSLTERPTTTAA